MRATTPLLVLAVACSAPAASKPAPASRPPASAPAASVGTTRIHGPIEGQIELASQSVVVGEPIVAVVTAHAKSGTLPVYVGGDQRNAAAFPTRLTFKVFDAKDRLVCDTLGKPAIMSFGGIGSVQTFPAGTDFRETAVLNAMCPALASPGDYRIVLHRRLSHDDMTVRRPGNDTPLSCDIYPVHEGPLPDGYEPGCAPLMADLPSLTRSIALHVAPFDAARFRQGSEARWREARSADGKPDASARSRIAVWLAGWIACRPTESMPTEHERLGALPDRLPATFPTECSR